MTVHRKEKSHPYAKLFPRLKQLGDASQALSCRTHSTAAAARAYRDAAADKETVVLTLMLMLAEPSKR